MNKNKNKIKKYISKRIIIIGVVVFILLVGLVAVLIVNSKTEKSIKNRYEKIVRELGQDFYENHYYDLVTAKNGNAYIEAFSELGFTIDLDSLSSISIKSKNKASKLEGKDYTCNKYTTKVVIHPKDPYGMKDYDMDVILDCGFEK
jgi:hypothetical protein